MSKRIIYHHPDIIVDNGDRGSQVRPSEMLAAFKALGFTVDEVTGTARQRAIKIKSIKQQIRQGTEYLFLYSENRSIPTPLTESHRVPLHPFQDHLFFRFCRLHAIPVGLFYRDIYWRFSMYKEMLSPIVRAITIPLYWYDWIAHRYTVDHLFLPSLKMARHLPTAWPSEHLSALPPGTAPPPPSSSNCQKSTDEPLSILYIGGVLPPSYDITPLFKTIKRLNNVRLTLVCRAAEWEVVESYYEDLPQDKINVLHISGEALQKEYRTAGLFAILREPDVYLDFAVPVKVFEAAANSVPIIILDGSEAADVVKREELGWVEQSLDDVVQRINEVNQDRSILIDKATELSETRQRHTWESRANIAAETLTGMKKG